MSEENLNEFSLPAFNRFGRTDVVARPRMIIQTPIGDLPNAILPIEYYTRQLYDNISEKSGTVAAGVVTQIDFQVPIIKTIWIFVPATSASILYWSPRGPSCQATDGNINIQKGEGRQFTFPMGRFAYICSDGVGTATYRITWGW